MTASHVLVCAPTGRDCALLARYLLKDATQATCYDSIEHLADALNDGAAAIIIAEEALTRRGVERLFGSLKNQSAWSDITVILLTHAGEESAQVSSGLVHLFGSHANVNMLERPIRVPTLISAVRSALRARKRQYEVRDLLQQREQNERVLQEARDELERRVLQRTLEITRVNSDLRREVSDRLTAENALRQLSQNVVRLQDEERRKIARELHDSAGQYLSAVTLTLGQLARRLSAADDRNKELVQEALAIVGDCIREVRTMSYLLHPPVLDDFGLGSALRWYVEGFSQRSGIIVSLELEEGFPRFNPELETTLFRIVQEGLTNVHRHSGSKRACVELRICEQNISTTITDTGHGMPQEVLRNAGKGQGGVGLMGMYERVKKLGGTIQIDSGSLGTTIKALLPFAESAGVSAALAGAG
ncbi:MAG: sensor histidine kinase [Acidobacteriota bacterium]|nr:sensor histidine kinase [Acidobacteriota bacterium]